jgi:hypothetical protein
VIISASRRTDIPAFFARWLMERVRAGFCEVPNPFRAGQCSVVSLRPEDVDCFVFWTRAPAGLLGHLPELHERGYRWYFLYTLLDYPPAFETHAPGLAERLRLLRAAAESTPAGGVVWRYDPILLSSATPVSFHVDTFSRLAGLLRGTVERVVVSLFDRYRKTERGLAELQRDGITVATEAEHAASVAELFSLLAGIAREQGMHIQSCAEGSELETYGVSPGRCVDDALIRRLYGTAVSARKDSGQRGACRCVASRDIGCYDTCLHGCRYCYATSSRERALAAYRRHRPEAAALVG